MARMETDYSKPTYFRWKIKWPLENFGALGIMGEMWNVWGHLTLFWVNPTKARSGRKSWDIELCSYLLQVTNRWLKIECWSCPVGTESDAQTFTDPPQPLTHWPKMKMSVLTTGLICPTKSNTPSSNYSVGSLMSDFQPCDRSSPAQPIRIRNAQSRRESPDTFSHLLSFSNVSAMFDNHTILLFWSKNGQTFCILSLHDLCFVLCSLDLDVQRAQRIMGFFKS